MPAISITALANPVAIVYIPLNLSDRHSSDLYWSLIAANKESGEFFNVTSNCVEISIFASLDLVKSRWGIRDPDVRISSSWRVFEIGPGEEGDTGNYDSPHLRYVSSPLAREGISILYQSSYFADFLLVKEEDFERAARIFVSQGWQVSDSEPPVTRRRSGLYTSPRSASSRSSPSPPATPIPTDPEITVLHRPLACVGFSKVSERSCDERIRKYIVWPRRSMDEWAQQALDRLPPNEDGEGGVFASASEESVRRDREMGRRPFISYTRTQDGASLVTEVRALLGMFPEDDLERLDVQCAAGELSSFDDSIYDDEGEDDDDDDVDLDDDDQVDSIKMEVEHTSPILPAIDMTQLSSLIEGAPPTPPISTAGESSTSSSPTKKRLSLPFALSPPMLSPDSTISTSEIQISWSSTRPTTRSMSKSFSTLEAASEFSPLDDIGGNDNGRGMKKCLQLDLRAISQNPLQSAYNLDKSGLVTRFSDLLESAHIKMLYSSTFHTANILVESGDVLRAKRLLKRGKI